MKLFKIILSLFIFLLACNKKEDDIHPDTIAPNHPFPNHTSYIGNHIKPNNYSQTQLDEHTKSFYDDWQSEYLKNDCNSNEYYVFSGSGAKTVSEAHGYGMIITAFMAGYDPHAKTYFDGLFHYYKSHPSIINNHLMDWQQINCSDSPGPDDDAASDGDIDIAFSLLLAHEQWGSSGNINYLEEARAIIYAIMQDEINPGTRIVKLGDWCDSTNPVFYYGTRTSDFITSHFKVFATVTGNTIWNSVTDNCYALIENIQSPATGLVPDFIINTNTTPVPAGPDYLEDIHDGDYYYNACRFPWRIGTDYLLSGDNRAKISVNKLNTWLIASSSGIINSISNGYQLNGTPVYNWNDATFIGPFAVGAMCDINSQTWLNSLYSELLLNNTLSDGDYYSNTIKLLSMLTISGNYWNPALSDASMSLMK